MEAGWGQVLVAVLSMLGIAGYTVMNVRTATAVLGEKISGLKKSVDSLREARQGHDDEIRTLEHRVTVLEQNRGQAR